MSDLFVFLIVWWGMYSSIGIFRQLTSKPPMEVGEQLFESFIIAFVSTMIVVSFQPSLWE